MTQRASISTKTAFLSSEFGENFANRHFSDEQIESMGRLSKGKNKGKLRGAIRWQKVDQGGWVSVAKGEGYVENRRGQVIVVELCDTPWGEEMKPKHFKGDQRPVDKNHAEWVQASKDLYKVQIEMYEEELQEFARGKGAKLEKGANEGTTIATGFENEADAEMFVKIVNALKGEVIDSGEVGCARWGKVTFSVAFKI